MTQSLETAIALTSQGKYEAALEILEAVLRENPQFEPALVEMGKTYKMMDRLPQALETLMKVIAINPRQSEALFEFGEVSQRVGEGERAVRILTEIVKKDPRNRPALTELGKSYFAAGEHQHASDALTQALEIEPNNSATWGHLGQVHKAAGKRQEALNAFERALQCDPRNDLAHAELGRIYREDRNYSMARKAFENALLIKPADLNLQLELIDIHVRGKNWKAAEEQARKGLETVKSDDPFRKDRFLNELEILQGKTILESHPKMLWVGLTSVCNIRCRICSMWQKPWYLPEKRAEEVRGLYPYLQHIVWYGGEVFFYPNFRELFDEATKYPHLGQQVITNGTFFTDEWLERFMCVRKLELTVSIDGTTKDVYESIRRGAKFDDLIGKLKALARSKEKHRWPGKLRMNVAIMKSNYREIEHFVDFAKEYGFDMLCLMAITYAGSHEENIFDCNRDEEALEFITEAIPKIRKRAKEYGLALDVLLPTKERSFEQSENVQTKTTEQEPNVRCNYPWRIMQLADDGRVELTGTCLKPIGNYHENSLMEIWNSPTAQQYRKAILDGKFQGFCRPQCMSRWDQ